jgi:hypothetical protein
VLVDCAVAVVANAIDDLRRAGVDQASFERLTALGLLSCQPTPRSSAAAIDSVAAAQGVEPAPEKLDVVALHSALPSMVFRTMRNTHKAGPGATAQSLRRRRRAKAVEAGLADSDEWRGGA